MRLLRKYVLRRKIAVLRFVPPKNRTLKKHNIFRPKHFLCSWKTAEFSVFRGTATRRKIDRNSTANRGHITARVCRLTCFLFSYPIFNLDAIEGT